MAPAPVQAPSATPVQPASRLYQSTSLDHDGGGLWDCWWIMRKRIWALPLMLTAGLVVGILWPVKYRPVYTSEARVMVRSTWERMVPGVNPAPGTVGLETQIEILKSTDLALEVIRKLNLHCDRDYVPGAVPTSARPVAAMRRRQASEPASQTKGPSAEATDSVEGGAPSLPQLTSPESLVRIFLGHLRVARVGGTSLVSVRYTAPTAALSRDVVNATVEALIEMELARNMDSVQKALDYFRGQMAKFRNEMEDTEREIFALEKELNIVVVRGDETFRTLDLLQEKVTSLAGLVTKATQERIQNSIRYKRLKALAANRRDVVLTPEVRENATLQKLFEQRANVVREREALLAIAGNRNPHLAQLGADLKRIDGEIDAEIRNIIDFYKARAADATDRESQLRTELQKAQERLALLNDKKWQYVTLRRDATLNTQLYDLLLKQNKEMRLTQDLTASKIQIISRGALPGKPARPRRWPKVRLGLLLGLIAGLGLAFGLDWLDRSVQTIEDVEKLLHMPVLTSVDRFSKKKPHRGPPELIMVSNPRSLHAEAFRSLRMRLSVGRQMKKTVLVTSAGPSEGKSTIASNLAAAFAETGKRVLLIDADIRKPSIRKVFELSDEACGPGLVAYLKGELSLEEAVRPAPDCRNLWILPTTSGITAAEVGEILEVQRVAEMLQEAEERHDCIVVDSPAMAAVSEPLLLASLIKCVLMVARTGRTTRGMVRRAVEQLAEAGVKPVGVALNFADVGRQSSYGYYYYSRRGYYGYGGYSERPEERRQEAVPQK